MQYYKLLCAATLLFTLNTAQAAVDLDSYTVNAVYDLSPQSGLVSGLEASAITYAPDRNSLFFIGDEGTGVIEVSLTGETLGYMRFDWNGTGSTKHDTEGLTYIGNGQLVVSEERLQDAYKFTFKNRGTAKLADNYVSISDAKVKNHGIEGISYDAAHEAFITIKQDAPEDVLYEKLSFSAATGGLPSELPKQGISPAGGGVAKVTKLFDPTSLGLTTLSDVQTLEVVGSDDLLILSLGSRKLVKVDRSGHLLSTFDLANVLPHNGIEGVTIDGKGNIYLVAEELQGEFSKGNDTSELIVLSPIPAVVAQK